MHFEKLAETNELPNFILMNRKEKLKHVLMIDLILDYTSRHRGGTRSKRHAVFTAKTEITAATHLNNQSRLAICASKLACTYFVESVSL